MARPLHGTPACTRHKAILQGSVHDTPKYGNHIKFKWQRLRVAESGSADSVLTSPAGNQPAAEPAPSQPDTSLRGVAHRLSLGLLAWRVRSSGRSLLAHRSRLFLNERCPAALMKLSVTTRRLMPERPAFESLTKL